MSKFARSGNAIRDGRDSDEGIFVLSAGATSAWSWRNATSLRLKPDVVA